MRPFDGLNKCDCRPQHKGNTPTHRVCKLAKELQLIGVSMETLRNSKLISSSVSSRAQSKEGEGSTRQPHQRA